MTASEFGLYATYASWLCLAMAVVNLARCKQRRWRAVIMSAAFVVMAISLNLLKNNAPQSWLIVSCIVLFILLVSDLVLKMAVNSPKQGKQ